MYYYRLRDKVGVALEIPLMYKSEAFVRIKRRSAFLAHLRRHGLDPNSLDINAVVLQSSERGIPAPTHFASLDVENKSHRKVQSRSVTPSFLSDSR